MQKPFQAIRILNFIIFVFEYRKKVDQTYLLLYFCVWLKNDKYS